MKGRGSEIQYSDALGVAIAQWGSLDTECLGAWAKELGVEDVLTGLLHEAKAKADVVG